MSDNVEVFIRVRALNVAEKEKNATKVVKCSEDKVSVHDKSYQFIGFGPEVSNDNFYEASLKNTVTKGITRGVNIGVVCVGESKTGKSTTLGLSSNPSPGIVALTADLIFGHVAKFSHFVGVSYLNIYQEKFTDLLNPADKELKIKTQPNLGVFVEELSELSVKNTDDLMRLYNQGNKVRKILEIEMGILSTKSHAVFTISCEYKDKEQKLIRSNISFYNIAGFNHSTDVSVSGSLKSLETLISDAASSKQPSNGYSGSKLTQLLRPVLDKSSYVTVLGHLSPSSASANISTRTLDLCQKCKQIQLSPTPNTLDTRDLIDKLRKRVAAARTAITSQTSENIPKEHISELDNSIAALSAAKRLQWDERERNSVLIEAERRQTLADQGVLEWITETAGQAKNSSTSVLLLQKEKDTLVSEYKRQRKVVDELKNGLQGMISSHTALAGQPNQSESVLQDSLAKIHKLRDQLKTGNEKLRDLKKGVKDAQDKLKIERRQGADEVESSGNFALTHMMKKDEIGHLQKDNQQFLEEEKERLQSECDQEIAEIKLSATQGDTLTLEQIVKIQEQHVQQNVQLSHLALHIQCLQAENEKFQETILSLDSAHKVEVEAQKARNLLTFRQYKDFFEEAKAETGHKYQELLNSCIQDCVFLSSKNAELTEENTELKRKLKHFN